MPDGRERDDAIKLTVAKGMGDFPAAEWDACAGGNPTLAHAFLSALEDSGSVTAETGWMPRHLAIWSESEPGRLLAAAPLYVKNHSYGEYVFDWGWADAYERAGGRYYPKLQCAVPFTPVPGRRLLTRGDLRPDEPSVPILVDALLAGMVQLGDQNKLSSLHVTFCGQEEWEMGGELGLLKRKGLQYHWRNQGYGSFEDFLAALASRKRKNLKKERARALSGGLEIRRLTGEDLKPEHWDAFHRFYLSTVDKKWAQAYLNRAFFQLLGERMADRALLVMAEMEGRPVAGALNLIGEDALYGRNWGALAEFDNLHFECCYYQAIEFAIERGLARVEAGAQGEHKIRRGYLPVETYSLHWIADPALAEPVANFVRRESESIEEDARLLMEHSPYRQTGDS
ncbi:MAG: GNAT family N-acetyltransferase [Limibacillus sp.]